MIFLRLYWFSSTVWLLWILEDFIWTWKIVHVVGSLFLNVLIYNMYILYLYLNLFISFNLLCYLKKNGRSQLGQQCPAPRPISLSLPRPTYLAPHLLPPHARTTTSPPIPGFLEILSSVRPSFKHPFPYKYPSPLSDSPAKPLFPMPSAAPACSPKPKPPPRHCRPTELLRPPSRHLRPPP